VNFHGADGGNLRGALFPAPNARATVIVLTGRSEFIEKYFEVILNLRRRGLSAAIMDWRGQGLSERLLPVHEKGHIPDFGVFKSDLRVFMSQIVKPALPGPYLILAHSMGGVPALQTLADGDETYRAAILCAPMTRLYDGLFRRVGVRLVAEAASRIGLSRAAIAGVKEHSMAFEGNFLTTDRARHARFRELQAAAPNATIREPTYGWVRAATEAMDDLHRKGRYLNLKTPTLIVSAENDHFVRTSDHRWIAAQSALIENAVIDGALHEILMERDALRDRFWALFDAFIDPRIGAPVATTS